MIEQFTIIAFSENAIGLLNRVTIIFTRRHLNIESLTVSQSAIADIHKFTIVINSTYDQAIKVTKQIEKLVEVLKAFCLSNNDIINMETALYKVPTEPILNTNIVEEIVRKNGARIIEITPDYTVISKTGHEDETTDLFEKLANNGGVKQFTRSGRIAVTRSNIEPLSEFLNARKQE